MNNEKELIKGRYERLRAVGFNSRIANRYKYHKDSSVNHIIDRKKRYDKLLPFLDNNKEEAWRLAGSYNDAQTYEMIKNLIAKEL